MTFIIKIKFCILWVLASSNLSKKSCCRRLGKGNVLLSSKNPRIFMRN